MDQVGNAGQRAALAERPQVTKTSKPMLGLKMTAMTNLSDYLLTRSPMTPRVNRVVTISSLVVVWMMSCVSPVQTCHAADRPNIVFIIADDLGFGDAGFMGTPDVRTPALDDLAARSVLFDRTFVASPSCAPSRGALLSGLMPFRNGAEPNHTLVRDDVRQLPSYMHEIGYEVASIGKVTHGTDKRAGFDFGHPKSSMT